MALKSERQDWRALKINKKKRKLEQVEQYLETKKKIEIVEKSKEQLSIKSNLSIAIAGSIVDNVQSEELAMSLAGQIGRAAAIYKVDELIVFDDTGSAIGSGTGTSQTWENCVWLAKILQFLECPQYLRKDLFPLERDFRLAGMLNPLDMPHHLRRETISAYREGVVLDDVHPQLKHSYVNVGLTEKVKVDQQLEPGSRVTVKFSSEGSYKGTVVTPQEPKALGLFWGYEVRLAKSLSAVFTDGIHKHGYNLTIGTSDKGQPLSDIIFPFKKRRRTLIVIGGLQGLEFALSNDPTLKNVDISHVFDHYTNVCPGQGSRTIRSEEALFISLALITDKLNALS